jgi:hypothetical protein
MKIRDYSFLRVSYLKKNEIRDMYSLKENQNFEKNSLAKMLVLTIQKLEPDHTLKSESTSLVKVRIVNSLEELII